MPAVHLLCPAAIVAKDAIQAIMARGWRNCAPVGALWMWCSVGLTVKGVRKHVQPRASVEPQPCRLHAALTAQGLVCLVQVGSGHTRVLCCPPCLLMLTGSVVR